MSAPENILSRLSYMTAMTAMSIPSPDWGGYSFTPPPSRTLDARIADILAPHDPLAAGSLLDLLPSGNLGL